MKFLERSSKATSNRLQKVDQQRPEPNPKLMYPNTMFPLLVAVANSGKCGQFVPPIDEGSLPGSVLSSSLLHAHQP